MVRCSKNLLLWRFGPLYFLHVAVQHKSLGTQATPPKFVIPSLKEFDYVDR
jgi:hypothetical protein